jgi:TolA-binding protein
MNLWVKSVIYLVLVIAAVWLGRAFYSEFKSSSEIHRSGSTAIESELSESNDAPASATNSLSTNTNVLASVDVPSDETNNSAITNVVVAKVKTNSSLEKEIPKRKPSNSGKMVLFLGLFLLAAICLGLFVAHDISHYMGSKAVKVLYNDDLEGVKNPEYDQAEQEWANGNFLDAIQKMRDYLKKNPREQHVALRIAEIYEKDLNNPLAAALEYEEVLKYKLPDERWGWAAIHLANIYSGKLNKEADAIALLRRIYSEYSQTGAAKKARERLEKVDPGFLATTPPANPPAEPESPSNLPPGFRPRK